MVKNVIIIGGGPAGYHSALSCHNAGMKVTLIEQDMIGGTCAHKGCIPTRAYLTAIKAKHQLAAANPSLAPLLTINGAELAETTQKKINQLTFGMDYIIRKKKISYIQDKAVLSGEKEVMLSDGSRLTCDALIIATGASPITLKTHPFSRLYSEEELLKLENLPDELTIVGAGVLGTELAVILNELGCKITLLEKASRILPGWDEDVSTHMEAYLKALGIRVETSANHLFGDTGVFCIGRKPILPQTNAHLDIHAPWIHILGDADGGSLTADIAIHQGDEAPQYILGTKSGKTKSSARARCLFTPLEAAMTGDAASPEDLVVYQDIGYTSGGVLFGSDLGFIKIVMDRDTHVLKGVHIVSAMASELIQLCQLAVSQKLTAEQLMEMTFPHPTEGELLKDVLRSAL